MTLLVEKTKAPFGVENSGGIFYLKVLLYPNNKNHDFIRDRLDFFEQQDCKNMKVMSNIRRLKDGNDLLKIRIKVFRGKKTLRMKYHQNSLKEDYLKTIDEIPLDAEIDVLFSIGKGFIFKKDGEDTYSLNLYVEEVLVR